MPQYRAIVAPCRFRRRRLRYAVQGGGQVVVFTTPRMDLDAAREVVLGRLRQTVGEDVDLEFTFTEVPLSRRQRAATVPGGYGHSRRH